MCSSCVGLLEAIIIIIHFVWAINRLFCVCVCVWSNTKGKEVAKIRDFFSSLGYDSMCIFVCISAVKFQCAQKNRRRRQ